ncbi:MAG: EF-hand domain-containing protein [Pseudomonadota bacterium]
MLRSVLSCLAAVCLMPAAASLAQSADGDLVRLPGTGTAKEVRPGEAPARFVPGGGLILSFDVDRNGVVTPAELERGVARAFEQADASEDGVLSALEQQAWAESLPTRDDSLANPVRFDPNLDREVSADEFAAVVSSISAAYVDPATGNITVASLKAPEGRERARRADRQRLGQSPRVNF